MSKSWARAKYSIQQLQSNESRAYQTPKRKTVCLELASTSQESCSDTKLSDYILLLTSLALLIIFQLNILLKLAFQ